MQLERSSVEGEESMTQRKQTTMKQGTVKDVMSHLSRLPEREKDPTAPITLPEIFRSKEYVIEIEKALQRGYSFNDLAAIFTERCGVSVSARQLKYHRTREKNQLAKGKKSKRAGVSKSSVPSENTSPIGTKGEEENSLNVAKTLDASYSQGFPPAPKSTAPKTGVLPNDRQRQDIEGD